MLVQAYDYLNKIKPVHLQQDYSLFNKTAQAVCEGQQLDMDFEKRETVSFDEYVEHDYTENFGITGSQFANGCNYWEGQDRVISNIYMSLEKTWVLLSRYRMITWMHLVIRKNLENKSAEISLPIRKLF